MIGPAGFKRLYWLSRRHPLTRAVWTSLVVSAVWAVASSHAVPALQHLGSVGGLDLAGALALSDSHPARDEWEIHDGKYWQHVATRTTLNVPRPPSGACRSGMLEVEGESLDGAPSTIDDIEVASCAVWADPATKERCARFDRAAWERAAAKLRKRNRHFCIDELEYPNEPGAYPWIMVSWREAGALCKAEGKRLCGEEEWTFACEGVDALPYPYGFERNDQACNIDRSWRRVDEAAVGGRTDARALAQIDRLWQGEVSGSRPRCASPFGVRDMTGNVDEWTVGAGEHRSVLKGGYWGPVRARCRPATRSHGEDFTFYQIGFRCCADAPVLGAADAQLPAALAHPAQP
jgi:formylglycine-generating enzyme